MRYKKWLILGSVIAALALSLWINAVHKNPAAGAVIVVTVVALGVWLGSILSKTL